MFLEKRETFLEKVNIFVKIVIVLQNLYKIITVYAKTGNPSAKTVIPLGQKSELFAIKPNYFGEKNCLEKIIIIFFFKKNEIFLEGKIVTCFVKTRIISEKPEQFLRNKNSFSKTEFVSGKTRLVFSKTGTVYRKSRNIFKKKKSLAQEVRQKSDISEHRSKG